MVRIIVSDTALGAHANAVKAAISLGYGSDIASQIEIRTGGLSSDLAYASSIGAIAVVRSTTGYSGYNSLALSYYPNIQVFMPLGINTFEELYNGLECIVTSGAGDAENQNNTGYGIGLEFWDNDYETSVSADISSYSNGVVAGKILKIKDTLDCLWWEARYRARMTCDKGESNRINAVQDLYNGFGKINVTNAVAYSDAIIDDPNASAEPEPEPEPEPEILNNNIMIDKTFNIDLAQTNECNFSFIRGDTFRLIVNVKNNGVVFNLTDYTPILTAMLDEMGTTNDIQLYGADVDITKASEGTFTFTFSPTDTESLTAGSYYYDIQITSISNTYTIIKSTLELIQDVTKGTDVNAKYKVYSALLTQTGTDAPVATVLENTLGGTVVWTRNSTGVYFGTLASAFTVNKTFIFPAYSYSDATFGDVDIVCSRASANVIRITNNTAGNTSVEDGVMTDFPIEIRVYN